MERLWFTSLKEQKKLKLHSGSTLDIYSVITEAIMAFLIKAIEKFKI